MNKEDFIEYQKEQEELMDSEDFKKLPIEEQLMALMEVARKY